MTSPYVTGPVTTYQGIVGDSRTDPLTNPGFKWGTPGLGGAAAISFSFPNYGAAWHSDYSQYLLNEPFNGFEPFTAEQQQAARSALTSWSNVANITFTEVADTPSDVGDIRFGNSYSVGQYGAAAWAYLPYTDPFFTYAESGDIWFDKYYAPNLELAPGQFGFMALVHESGHAIGLDHPFADGRGEPTLPSGQDNQRYTIMAYTPYSGASEGFRAYGPMLYDILAIQRIYGANMAFHAGNDVYTFATDKEYLECIWDAGGHDTIDLSNQTRNQVIDLREGMFSSVGVRNDNQTAIGNIGIAFNVTIEDAVGGSGADKITGNTAANSLKGGAGNDTLDGGDGADRLDGGANVDAMTGGKGNDVYVVDNAGDSLLETLSVGNGGGVDTVLALTSYSIAAFGNVENVVLVGTVGSINATGNANSNALIGNEGNNVLDGGGGVDVLYGGAGNDTYVVDNAGEIIDEKSNTDAHDRLRSASILFAATVANIEDYSYTGGAAWTFTGNSVDNELSGGTNGDTLDGALGNDMLLGNNGNDTLIGGVGDDWLDGGAGNDKMKGGVGNDTYTIDALTDAIDEEGNTDGDDVVRSSLTVSLATFAGGVIEHAVLTGAGAITATGTSIANKLTGNDGANRLDGGAGSDTLDGGKGNDTYVVDDAGDKVIESIAGASGGTDTIESALSLGLASFANVENLTLTGGAANGTGNGLANRISGTDGNNILNGLGGADTLIGGKGNDTYVVNQADDVVTEALTYQQGGGIDLVFAGASYSIAAFANVENLVLSPGAGNGNITGSSMANALIGNAFNNVLDGGGGPDLLFGGAGNDTYIIDNAGDKADEQGNTDTGDEVRSATVLLGAIAGIENYKYTGTAAWNFTGDSVSNVLSGGSNADTLDGADGNDTISGNGGNDTLIGGAGDDWLDGGAGNDKLLGGSGNDTYVIDTALDTIDEEGNADADDTVRSSVTVSLASLAGGAIEHVVLTGVAAINANGNAAANKLTGNDAANTLDGGIGADILEGGKGNDVYLVDDAGDQVLETVAGAPGGIDTVQSAISFSLAALGNIENLSLAAGTANLNATGNGNVNALIGNDGNNVLDGGAGADTLVGNKGDDSYIIDNAGDTISETIAAGGGVDTALAYVSYSIAFANVENIELVAGTGNTNATGNAMSNAVLGNEGNNTLDGGAGADLLFGGAGNDVYVIDNAGDVANEQGNADSDDELRTANVLLAAVTDIENYTYTGAAAWGFTGNALNNKISGGTGNDTLDGAEGNDTLLGNNGNDTLIGSNGDDWLEGGAGVDAMKGGSGNDTYVIADAGDTIDEEANSDADDLVRATISVDLAALGAGTVEHAILLGGSALTATGSDTANKLIGNDAANTLDGGGGADTLTGGKGDDTYVVDSLSDQVIELADEGINDLIKSSISFSLASVANVENLTLVNNLTGNNINGTGDSKANVIVGNDGNNVLNGAGGNDTLIGGKGGDTYVVDTLDTVSETISNALGGGIDTIIASFSYSIAALANIDNVILTGTAGSATGNAAANVLLGNSVANLLDGGGGADVMRGGAGDDAYVIDHVSDAVDEQSNTDEHDSVRSATVLLSVFAGVENYYYQGAANWTFVGTSANNIVEGGSGNDTLSGGAGDDQLNGGAGNDKLKGGSGNDTYYIDNANDKIDEEGNADAKDVVVASVSVNLAALGAGIEDVTLLGNAPNAFGDDSANTLIGNAADNQLDGGGGADKLYGGDGNDVFIVDSLGDEVYDSSGTDILKSSISISLASFSGIEWLTLLGTGNINGTGKDNVHNYIYGNSGDNILDGGIGADYLYGSAGNDTYIVDANDTVVEYPNAIGGGIDTVLASTSFNAALIADLENITLTGIKAIDATGNVEANTIIGNDANNQLSGNEGNDRLIGNGGMDFIYAGSGSDYILGGLGGDYIAVGSEGGETVDFDHLNEGGDMIHYFRVGAGGDVIDLHDVLSDVGYAGSDPFADGYVSFVFDGTFHTQVQVDADGAGAGAATTMATLYFANLSQANTDNYIV